MLPICIIHLLEARTVLLLFVLGEVTEYNICLYRRIHCLCAVLPLGRERVYNDLRLYVRTFNRQQRLKRLCALAFVLLYSGDLILYTINPYINLFFYNSITFVKIKYDMFFFAV